MLTLFALAIAADESIELVATLTGFTKPTYVLPHEVLRKTTLLVSDGGTRSLKRESLTTGLIC